MSKHRGGQRAMSGVVDRARRHMEELSVEERPGARQSEVPAAEARVGPVLRLYKRFAIFTAFVAAASVAGIASLNAAGRPKPERSTDARPEVMEGDEAIRQLRARADENLRAITALQDEVDRARKGAAELRSYAEDAGSQAPRVGGPKARGGGQLPPPAHTGALSDECAGSRDPLCGLHGSAPAAAKGR